MDARILSVPTALLPFVRVVLHLVPYHVPWYRTSLVRMVRSIIVHVRHDSALIMCRCMCLVCRLSTVRFSSFHCTLFKFTPLLDMPAYIHEHAFIPTHTFAHGAISNLQSSFLVLSALSRPGDTRRRRAAGAAGLLLARSFPKHEAAASTLCRPLTGPRWCRPRTPPPREQGQQVAA